MSALASLAAASGRLRTQAADDALLRRWQTRATVWAASCDAAGASVLLDAFHACLSHCDAAARLLVLDPGAEAAVSAAAEARGIGAHVECVGAGADARKAALLAADALVVCGGSAAFVLDALAVGTPVTGVGCAAATDAGGDATLLWRAGEPAAVELIAATVERLRADARLRARLRARGHARVSGIAASPESPA